MSPEESLISVSNLPSVSDVSEEVIIHILFICVLVSISSIYYCKTGDSKRTDGNQPASQRPAKIAQPNKWERSSSVPKPRARQPVQAAVHPPQDRQQEDQRALGAEDAIARQVSRESAEVEQQSSLCSRSTTAAEVKMQELLSVARSWTNSKIKNIL